MSFLMPSIWRTDMPALMEHVGFVHMDSRMICELHARL